MVDLIFGTEKFLFKNGIEFMLTFWWSVFAFILFSKIVQCCCSFLLCLFFYCFVLIFYYVNNFRFPLYPRHSECQKVAVNFMYELRITSQMWFYLFRNRSLSNLLLLSLSLRRVAVVYFTSDKYHSFERNFKITVKTRKPRKFS